MLIEFCAAISLIFASIDSSGILMSFIATFCSLSCISRSVALVFEIASCVRRARISAMVTTSPSTSKRDEG